MDQYDGFFLKIENLKRMGALEEALEILLLMKEKVQVGQDKIQAEILKVKFMLGLYEEVLDEALSYVQNDAGVIWQWLLKEYCEPFQDDHQMMLKKNKEYLKQYPYFFGEAENTDCKILWYDAAGKLIFEENNHVSVYNDNLDLNDYKKIMMICNSVNADQLLKYQADTQYKGPVSNYKVPIYLFYDQDVFHALMQCIDFESLLKDKRVVLFVGVEQLENFYCDLQAVIPTEFLGYGREKVQQVLTRVVDKDNKDYIENLEKIKKYYEQSEMKIAERISRKKPRILFLTSYFTTIMKYHIRDCMRSVEKLGLKTEVLIEKDGIYRNSKNKYTSVINTFHPDVIFCIDHFRFEFQCPKQIVWISWVQDLLPLVLDINTPKKIGKKDIILNHFTTWEEFKKIGYTASQLIDAPIPANADVYKAYKLSKEEYHEYHCDICFVCHASDAEASIERLIKTTGIMKEDADVVYDIYRGYQEYVYETGRFFSNKQLFVNFIEGSLSKCFGRQASTKVIEYIADDMFQNYNQRVYRQALVDWILDAGFTNIKLWGNGWIDNEKYQAYAMGPAENGEVLSKIYQSAKIVIGNNVMTTSAARAWETMLSGGFYLSNYIPEEDDITDIRKIIEVGKDVIMFYDKEDLIEKIHYYLEHEDERSEMIQRGRKAALENMTFDILMERTLSEIAKRV